jgi:hypothetical protein
MQAQVAMEVTGQTSEAFAFSASSARLAKLLAFCAAVFYT